MSDIKLTPRDMVILSCAIQCLVNPDAMQIDTEKLARLAVFTSGKSANSSWLNLKKKLLGGATFDPANMTSTPKKKGKAVVNEEGGDVDEATSSAAASKKRVKAATTESADTEGGDADTEKTPSIETPKKSRAKKATAAPKTDVTGDATNEAAASEVVTPTPKRKRGPNKPKDPNATPTKRAKKGAKAGITTTQSNEHNVANAQVDAGGDIAQTVEGTSMVGSSANVKNGDVKEDRDNRSPDAEMVDTHAEDQLD